MKYTRQDVINILKTVSGIDAELVLNNWDSRRDNEYLDLNKYHYPLFFYSFPIIIDSDVVATVTLAQFTNTGIDHQESLIMSKYLTTYVYNHSWMAYSHETYKHCYLTIHKEFELPPHPKDESLRVMESHFMDSEGNQIKYNISYGYSEIEGLYNKYVFEGRGTGCYRFDNDVNIQIEAQDIHGWSMGEKVNEIIKIRVRDQKIDNVCQTI